MPAKVDKECCVGCAVCVDACPVGAISMNEDNVAVVNADECTECGVCVEECPSQCISME